MDGCCLAQSKRIGRLSAWLVAACVGMCMGSHMGGRMASAQEAQWIWHTGTALSDAVPKGQITYFRKAINLRQSARGEVTITADDRYLLYVNGRLVGRGDDPDQMSTFEVGDLLTIGRNMVAVAVQNRGGDHAAFAARVAIQPTGSAKWFNFNSDASWKSSQTESANWQTVVFNDRLWGPASSLGVLGDTIPFDRPASTMDASAGGSATAASTNPSGGSASGASAGSDASIEPEVERRERFQIQRGFGVQRLLGDEQVGSVIAMTFNEFGHLIVSQEGGPLLLVYDKDDDGVIEHVRTYCDQVNTCQGVLALNGEVFVTGMGPEGHALYRCTDVDRSGSLEQVKAIVKFEGPFGEHAAHGLRLGPDGMIYVAVGSHVRAIGEGGPGETIGPAYEGDVLPRYEDPAGHGRGVAAPGGTIIRTNVDGSVVERIAGGLRNVYDLTFNASGALLVHDADMEADVETAWYRPTTLMDVTEGGAFGWRPGWSKWPEHYFDRLPNLADTGRGSPTGSVCYDHYMYPVRYQNSLFLADWSEGRILNVRLKPNGSSYDATTEVFLQGQPLNVTDLEVGPDGSMYFCTGGRGTAGGVYRVHYKGEIPDRMKNLGTGIAAAVRQPQMESAWARQEVASIKRELGVDWGQLVAGVAYSDDNPPAYRTRALDLMQLFGPVPSDEVLIDLSSSPTEAVRAKSAALMGLHPSIAVRDRLEKMLDDSDPAVRRAACQAMLRSGQLPSTIDPLLKIIGGEDRTLTFVARSLLQRMPVGEIRTGVLSAKDPHTKIVGMLALVNADTTAATCRTVLRHCGLLMDDYLSDADFVDNLRLIEIAISRGGVKPEELPRLRDQIAEEFPAGDSRMNHELIRLAAFLGADTIADRALQYLASDAPRSDRTLVAMCLHRLAATWTPQQRFQLLKYYENAATGEQDGSSSMYVMAATRDFAKSLSDDDVAAIIEQGAVWRNAALAALYRVPRPLDDATAKRLRNLDRQLLADPKPGDVQRRLRTGIIAMLASSTDPASGEYLRRLWRTEPERRAPIAMTLAGQPEGDNWDYLVRSLSILEESTSDTVIQALLSVPVATDDPMALRQLILLGVRNQSNDLPFENIEKLLEHWTGLQRPQSASVSMRPWQKWFAKTYPDRLPAEPPAADQSRWDFEQLVEYLNDEGDGGNPDAGRLVYEKAKCGSCHQFRGNGDSIGPVLTTVAKRFAKREIVESILYPGHVVSDQYASKKVLTLDGKLIIGMVADRGDVIEIRDAGNNITEIARGDVDQILPSTTSIMPSGLLDDLTMTEISDLMAYLTDDGPAAVATRPSGSSIDASR